VKQPESTDQIDQGVGSAELVKVDLRFRKTMEPCLSSTQAGEGREGRTPDVLGNVGRGDRALQIGQRALNAILGSDNDASAAHMTALLVPNVNADLVAQAQCLDRGIEDRALRTRVN
jgi:hypothetical protein